MLRKTLITLGCVAAIGMAGAGTASASAQQARPPVETKKIAGTNFKSMEACDAKGRHMVAADPDLGGWSCMLNQKGLYTLRVF